MLLIDGVKYQERAPTNENELEQVINEHAPEIFGENSIYFDRKLRLKALSGIGSIPDGYVIVFGVTPEWHIVEVELSSHQLYDHIVPQVGRFIAGIANPATRNQIVSAIHNEINGDDLLKIKAKKVIGSEEIYKFLSELISKPPQITILIEKKTPELDDALNAINHPQKKVVEFRTFRRVGAEAVHAHLFEPISQTKLKAQPQPAIPTEEEQEKGSQIAGRVTFEELVTAGLLKDGQILYFYNTRAFKDERAQVVGSQNKLKYELDGNLYATSALAKNLLIKHGFTRSEYSVQGSKYWKTESDEWLIDLQEKVRKLRGDRK